MFHQPRILALTEAKRPAPLETESASIAFCLHAFPAFVFKSVRSEAPNALESRGGAFGRLEYLASARYQPVKKNPLRKTSNTCKQYWHSRKYFSIGNDEKTVLYCVGHSIIDTQCLE
jgi:hypothetical protein